MRSDRSLRPTPATSAAARSVKPPRNTPSLAAAVRALGGSARHDAATTRASDLWRSGASTLADPRR